MDDKLFALVLARMEYRQANFQSCFAPFPIVQHRPILGHGFIKIFQLDLKRAAPLRTWNFGPATLIIDKDPIGGLAQCAALAADQRQTKEWLARLLISVAIATLDLERDAGAARVFVELPFGARFSQSLPGALSDPSDHTFADELIINVRRSRNSFLSRLVLNPSAVLRINSCEGPCFT
jgi:hypothetical protein